MFDWLIFDLHSSLLVCSSAQFVPKLLKQVVNLSCYHSNTGLFQYVTVADCNYKIDFRANKKEFRHSKRHPSATRHHLQHDSLLLVRRSRLRLILHSHLLLMYSHWLKNILFRHHVILIWKNKFFLFTHLIPHFESPVSVTTQQTLANNSSRCCYSKITQKLTFIWGWIPHWIVWKTFSRVFNWGLCLF